MIRGIYSRTVSVCVVAVLLASCGAKTPPEPVVEPLSTVEPRPEIYADFTLTADLSFMTDDQLTMIGVLIEASEIMDELFWRQAYGDDHKAWLDSVEGDAAHRFAELNYGPWDRLDDEKPFIADIGPKPLGANFYPEDMTKEEFDAAYLPQKTGLYSLIRRDDEGRL
ncbi:MAG: Zn-dependent hydrolase, partial [Gammaproteobacteria bacterium]|nr:Zn-dependent hydrolase [Gammaproteobacteria bacterium]